MGSELISQAGKHARGCLFLFPLTFYGLGSDNESILLLLPSRLARSAVVAPLFDFAFRSANNQAESQAINEKTSQSNELSLEKRARARPADRVIDRRANSLLKSSVN